MKYLIDTITYDTYRNIKSGIYVGNYKAPKNVNLTELENFIDNNKENILIHSATLFELYVRCIKNTDIQRQYKDNNQINLGQFADDYRFIRNVNHFSILNEMPYYFDCETIVNHYNKGIKFDPKSYIEEKIEMEVQKISWYFSLITSICEHKSFDVYGDTVDLNLHGRYHALRTLFLEINLKKILRNYYYADERKEISVKNMDILLGYYLKMSIFCIKNKYLLLNSENRAEEAVRLLGEYGKLWTQSQLGNTSGVSYISNILKDKNDILSYLSSSVVKGIFKEISDKLSNVEKEYYLYLLKKTLLNKYKITKNDFTDFLITSAADYRDSNILSDEIRVITYDKKVKKFIEEKGYYYDSYLYSKLYVEY